VNAHFPVLEHRRPLVELAIRGKKHLARHAPRGAQDEVERLARVLGEVRKGREALGVEDVVEEKVDLAIVEEGVHRDLSFRVPFGLSVGLRPALNRT